MVLTEINIITQEIQSPLISEKGISLHMARLDLIHPVVSGNKLFKLHYFIETARNENKNTIVTMGGVYSNHLAATAYYCHINNLKSIGIIRGEAPVQKSHTLEMCEKNNMQLIYVSRNEYSDINLEKASKITGTNLEDFLFIPEGGFDKLGAIGAALIIPSLKDLNASHFCVAIGTGTTLSGLIAAAEPQQHIIGIPVLKGLNDITKRVAFLLDNKPFKSPVIFDNFHFGGYAKKTPELINFMNDFFIQYQIPTDFVYTGKMMFAVIEKIKDNFFPTGSKIVCLHTGGLQGNNSLPENALVF